MMRQSTVGWLLVLMPLTICRGEDIAAELKNATAALATETYTLAYKFREGEVLRYRVEHVSTVDTRISDNRQTSKSHSASTKAWKVQAVKGENMTFTHSVEDVQLWQETTGRDAIRYDSRSDEEVPPEYQNVVASLNKPLATVTMNPFGQILARESSASNPDLGFGGLVVPLPKQSIKVGHTWTIPDSVRLKDRNGRVKSVKTQVRYRLERVSAGIATISMKTQILTPITDAKLKSQLLQKISSGEIKFDIDAGRVRSKTLDWDETVIGFNGPASNMKYLARFTETLIDTQTETLIDTQTARNESASQGDPR